MVNFHSKFSNINANALTSAKYRVQLLIYNYKFKWLCNVPISYTVQRVNIDYI